MTPKMRQHQLSLLLNREKKESYIKSLRLTDSCCPLHCWAGFRFVQRWFILPSEWCADESEDRLSCVCKKDTESLLCVFHFAASNIIHSVCSLLQLALHAKWCGGGVIRGRKGRWRRWCRRFVLLWHIERREMRIKTTIGRLCLP